MGVHLKIIVISMLFFSMLCRSEVYYMDGAISDQVYIDFKRRVQDASLEKVERLVVNSQGGDMFSAMAIGLLVKKNNMDVEVRDICASSCANYIFPSGKRKFLNESSIVGYHGGMLQENMVSQIEQLLKTGRNEIGKQFKEGIASSTDSNPEVLRDLEIPASKTKISKSNYIYLQNYEKKYFAKNHVKCDCAVILLPNVHSKMYELIMFLQSYFPHDWYYSTL